MTRSILQEAGFLGPRCWRLALIAACGITGSPLLAATFPNLYTVSVMRDPAAASVRAEGIDHAMAILLTRVTGRIDAAGYPELAPLTGRAASLMTSYAELEDAIRVGFRRSAVEEALVAANWPIWGAERPLTQLWVAIDFGNGQRALLSEQAEDLGLDRQSAELVEAIRDEVLLAADQRGLPVSLPLLDLEDFSSISFAEIWGGFDLLIERASARYAADAALLVRIEVGPFGLDIRWSLLQDGRSRSLVSTAVRDGIDWVADQYAAEFSSIGGARIVRLAIEGVNSLADYGRVMSYLEAVSVLQAVDVAAFEGNVLSLRVAARGDESVLERLLTLDGVLVSALPASAETPAFGAPLTFRIAPGVRSPR
jgi:hypothetical protein